MGNKLRIQVEYQSIRDAQGKVIDYQPIWTLTTAQLRALEAGVLEGVPEPPHTLEEVVCLQRAQGRRG